MSLDLRREFESIVRQWGHDVLLQRRILRSQTGIYGTAENNGFSTKLERWTVRHTLQRETQLIAAMRTKPEGLNVAADLIYYFPWDARPKEGDRIYEMDERYDTAPKDDVRFASTSIIEYAQPMKGRGGRVEFWIVGSMRERPN